MKTLKFKTIAQKTYEVQFNEDAFFDHMKRCGVINIPIENQVSLYLNNLHESLLQAGVPYDAIQPQTIVYDINTQFKNRYKYTNEILTFNL